MKNGEAFLASIRMTMSLGCLILGSFYAFAVTVPHVVIILEENHSYSQVIGNSSMPYLNSLADKYGLATNYYASAHPSIPNYFTLTAGETVTFNDLFSGTYSGNNIVRQLILAGKTWKVYVEGLPHAGFIEKNPHYAFTYFTDVRNSAVQRLNIVPFTQLHTDLVNNELPNYSFIVPNHLHNALDGGTLAAADSWLKTNTPTLLNNPEFKKGGVMIVVFDESAMTDKAHGGGHIAMVVAGPNAVLDNNFTGFVQHPSLLKLTCSLLGLSNCPGKAATAPNITGMVK